MIAPREKKFLEFIKKEVNSESIADENLAIIHKYLGNEDTAKKIFEKVAASNFPSTRFAGLSEEGKKDPDLLIGVGKFLLIKGLHFNLAKMESQRAKQLFEWSAENCNQSDEDIRAGIKYGLFDNIALGYLWRGYSLLVLGRNEEACGLLKEVVPYFNRYKKKGGEVWRKVEYFLPKALVPLCEYKLNPIQENLQKAKAGIEEYVKSLQDNKDKLEGYLYYFHLKETFADAYATEKAPEQLKTPSKIEKPAKKLELPSSEYETKGSVMIFDREGSGSLEVFGTQNEFEAYVETVKKLGNFLVLSSLMELYATEGLQEPEPLIEECERLLSRMDVEREMKEKTKLILAVAKDAQKARSMVMLYFDPEV